MVIKPILKARGLAVMEVVIALGLIASVMLPLAFSFAYEQKLCRTYFFEAVALEIVDGEMEILAAGEWRRFSEGKHVYTVVGKAAQNLPAGKFILSIDQRELELAWVPAKRGQGGKVARKISREIL
jgi:hypothetical protein